MSAPGPADDLSPLVLAAYGFDEDTRLEPVSIGLINRTLLVFTPRDAARPAYVLQRLHPIFAASVNEDLDAVTSHLASRGLCTPRLYRTRDGAPCVTHEGQVYRAITYVHGHSAPRLPHARAAFAAGALVASFHRALDGFEYTFRHVRPAVHDTPRHLQRLRDALARFADGDASERVVHDAVAPLAEQILAHASSLAPLPTTRTRVIHGDLKVSNLLFDAEFAQGIALVDLDTLAHGALPVELGDALRSWCNPASEDEPAPVFSPSFFEHALAGYARGAEGMLDRDERDALVLGTETITTELAARFCVDALEDRYFGWDPSRFSSRRAHNLARAAGQLALATSQRAQRGALESAVRRAFT